jgi:hypothetical protein
MGPWVFLFQCWRYYTCSSGYCHYRNFISDYTWKENQLKGLKLFKIFTVLILCAGLIFSTSSCAVYVKDDNGQHKGWNKNSNNPHHSNTTNPGHTKGNSK